MWKKKNSNHFQKIELPKPNQRYYFSVSENQACFIYLCSSSLIGKSWVPNQPNNTKTLDGKSYKSLISTSTDQILCTTCHEFLQIIDAFVIHEHITIGCIRFNNHPKDHKTILRQFTNEGNIFLF